jgi:hypothetical protein
MKILTIEQAKAQGLKYFHQYDEDRYQYRDSEGISHLIHKGVEVAKGDWVHSYDLNRYQYTDKNDIAHLIHNGIEVASGWSVYSYDLNRYEYKDSNGTHHMTSIQQKRRVQNENTKR